MTRALTVTEYRYKTVETWSFMGCEPDTVLKSTVLRLKSANCFGTSPASPDPRVEV